MKKANTVAMSPLIEGYLSYLDQVGRKTPRTIVDVRCTLRRAMTELERVRPGVELWHLKLEDYLHWLEAERQCGSHRKQPGEVSESRARTAGICLAQRPR